MPPNIKVKRIVGGAEKIINAPCLAGEELIFFINAKYQPITISWRIQDFEKLIARDKYGIFLHLIITGTFFLIMNGWQIQQFVMVV